MAQGRWIILRVNLRLPGCVEKVASQPVVRAASGRTRACTRKALKIMKLLKLLLVLGCLSSLLAGLALAADKPAKQQTCCEKAAAEGKECKHKCCVTAHKEGKSCEKCNPNKEDLNLKKADPKASTNAAK
jgi:hypothetical protein